jgi:glycosyltransferase involved in cell wall biosynthesis
MPGLYRQFDAFLFTSTWQEPFGRVLVEALASGVAVIGTMTGGATEIMVEGENALTFSPEDSAGLADQIQKLYENPSLISQLAENGRELAISKFDISRMIAEIDEYLQTVNAR